MSSRIALAQVSDNTVLPLQTFKNETRFSDQFGDLIVKQNAAIPSPTLDELSESTIKNRTREATLSFLNRELSQDTKPQYNLATFVTTSMEPEAISLMTENLSKNFVDARAYPATAQIEKRCLKSLARLYHAPNAAVADPVGVSTLGSSEAIILAVLAMKAKWVSRQGQGPKPKPNIIISSVAQVCWKKAARYCEVDVQYVPCSDGRYVIDPLQAVDLVNEGTIGICCILGTTYTGEYEDVQGVNDLLLQRGLDVPIHVDAASGGFVAPFISPSLKWDFRLERVASINVSGHKYGQVYAGIGWAIWRSASELPHDLVFHLSYLGEMQSSFTLNFSKSSSHVIAQYYQFLRLGKPGYRKITQQIINVATHVASALSSLGFILLSQPDGHRGIPVVAFRTNRSRHRVLDEFDLSSKLEEKGWQVPAYYMPDPDKETGEKLSLLRVVCRVDFTGALCEKFIGDLRAVVGL
ncbi:glutamate decarboxylase [Aspergillus unguis]